MQLSEIEAFLAVIHAGSLSKAAQQLYITQPTMSHRLKSLEKEVGFQLLSRNKGQRLVEPTDAGLSFIPIAEKWCRLWDETINATSISPQPVFRVAATQTLSTYVMPYAYARFVARNLPVSLQLFSLHYRECYDAVETRAIDAVFVSRTMSSNRVSSIPVASERMVLLCSKASPYKGMVRSADLPLDKCVYMMWNHEYAMWHEYWFGVNQYQVTADSMRLVEQIVALTDMWAIVPISAALSVTQNGSLRYLELRDPPPNRLIYLLTLEPQNKYSQNIVEDLCSSMFLESL